MPLSNEQYFGVRPLSEAINILPSTPTIIRESGLFVPEDLSTTYVDITMKNNELTLVQSQPRGGAGQPTKTRKTSGKTFQIPHYPMTDGVFADEVQNLRAFGSENVATPVMDKVNDKAADMKADLEYTREHAQLGALQGVVVDADNTVIYDFNKEFGVTRDVYEFKLSSDTARIGTTTDKMLRQLMLNLNGDISKGFICFASPEFMDAYTDHPSIRDLYARFKETSDQYRDTNPNMTFNHRGVQFVTYTHKFGSEVDIKAGEAHIAPLGTRKTTKEYFAPANYNATVNTKALAYYLSREKKKMDKGWDLEAQTNSLSILLRLKAAATLRMS